MHLLSLTCIILKHTTTEKQNLNSSITLILPAAPAADGEVRGGAESERCTAVIQRDALNLLCLL